MKRQTYSVIISYDWKSTRFSSLKNTHKDTILVNAKNKEEACRKAYRALNQHEKRLNEEITAIRWMLPTKINLNAIQNHLTVSNGHYFI